MTILLKTVELPASNQHLPEPLREGEIVKYVGENNRKTDSPKFDSQFIRIERMKTKTMHTFFRRYFIDVKTKKQVVPQS